MQGDGGLGIAGNKESEIIGFIETEQKRSANLIFWRKCKRQWMIVVKGEAENPSEEAGLEEVATQEEDVGVDQSSPRGSSWRALIQVRGMEKKNIAGKTTLEHMIH